MLIKLKCTWCWHNTDKAAYDISLATSVRPLAWIYGRVIGWARRGGAAPRAPLCRSATGSIHPVHPVLPVWGGVIFWKINCHSHSWTFAHFHLPTPTFNVKNVWYHTCNKLFTGFKMGAILKQTLPWSIHPVLPSGGRGHPSCPSCVGRGHFSENRLSFTFMDFSHLHLPTPTFNVKNVRCHTCNKLFTGFRMGATLKQTLPWSIHPVLLSGGRGPSILSIPSRFHLPTPIFKVKLEIPRGKPRLNSPLPPAPITSLHSRTVGRIICKNKEIRVTGIHLYKWYRSFISRVQFCSQQKYN